MGMVSWLRLYSIDDVNSGLATYFALQQKKISTRLRDIQKVETENKL
jgi:hypothetical protein